MNKKTLLILGILSTISANYVNAVHSETVNMTIEDVQVIKSRKELDEEFLLEFEKLQNEKIRQEQLKLEEELKTPKKEFRERDYIEEIIYEISNTYNFPELLLQAIIKAESNFDPDCIGPDTMYGNAHGLMQLLPSTAESLGVTDIFDPYQNVDAGTRYLIELMGIYSDKQYYDHLGNPLSTYEMAIMAYNWGFGNLNNHLDMHGVVVIDEESEYGIPSETYNYLLKIRNYCEEGKLSYEL